MKWFKILMVTGGIIFILANAFPVNSQTQKPIVIIQDMSQVFTYDPNRAFEFAAAPVIANTYERLVNFRGGDFTKAVPELAEKWSISDDGLIYTFNLRRGIKFSTGNELSAEDVIWSFQRLGYLKDTPSFLPGPIASMKAIDNYTVEIKLEKPMSGFLTRLTAPQFGILDRETVKAQGGTSDPEASKNDKATPWLNSHSAGTGAWMLVSYSPYQKSVLEPNPHYWQGPVYKGQVIIIHAKEAASRLLALKAGNADIALDLTIPQTKEIRQLPNFTILEENSFTPFFLAMTCKPELSKPLSDPRVRQAVKYALDVDAIVDKLLDGASEKPASILPVGYLGSSREFNNEVRIRRDVKKAKELLQSAGYPEGFSVDMHYPAGTVFDGVPYDALAPKVKADLAEAGITVQLVPGTRQTVLTAYRAGRLPMILFQFYFDYQGWDEPIEVFSPGPGGIVARRMGFEHERLKNLVPEAFQEKDRNKMIETLHEIVRLQVAEGPFAVVAQPQLLVPIAKAVKGITVSPVSFVDLQNATKE